MTKPLAALTATLALAGTTACGAEDPATDRDLSRDEAAVEQVTERWIVALTAGDGKTACALLTDKALADMNSFHSGCEQTVAEFGELVPGDIAVAADDVEVIRVRVDGDRATIKPEDIKVPEQLTLPAAAPLETTYLRRVDGAWKLDAST